MAEDYGQDSSTLNQTDLVVAGPIVTKPVVLSSGAGALSAGQILGVKTKDHLTVEVDPGNTGDADLSALSVTLGAAALPGVYTLTCTAESGDAGTFSVLAPNGFYLPDLTVASADGLAEAALVLATDVTVGDADAAALAYRMGTFSRDRLTGLTAAAEAQLDARGLFVR